MTEFPIPEPRDQTNPTLPAAGPRPGRGRSLRVRAAAAVVALAACGGTAWAATSLSGPGSASAAASTTTAAHATTARPAARGLLARADYATVEVKRHGRWVTLTLDRGKVTATSATSVTLTRRDGVTVTVALSATTRYHGAVSSAATIETGRPTTVIAEGGTALRVSQRAASAG